ncbi:LysM peptidoglycan-binding domain-containing protein [Dactylosporangium darangshiense]|uniref:LysM domain-containing protein n=1 Tax=Dactylosporangium darangshiense TaxID=579108 RepID=A0ABP8CTI9_9ACTN
MVQAGDTLASIAERMNVPGGWQALYERNHDVLGADPNLVRPGQQLSL